MEFKFCKECGEKLEVVQNFCHNCGKDIYKESKYFLKDLIKQVRAFFNGFKKLCQRNKKYFNKKLLIIIGSVCMGVTLVLTMIFVFNLFFREYEYSLNLPSDIIDLKLNGTVFAEDDLSFGVLSDNVLVSKKCVNNNYTLKPELGGFSYEATASLSCDSGEINFSDDDLSVMALLDFTSNYVNEIKYNDPKYREMALGIVENCPSGEIACYVNNIYKYVTTEIKYIGDVRDREYIEGVEKTLETGVGDCEDISIVTSSLLENLGIDTKMIFIEGHAYTMVCDMDLESVKKYIPENSPFIYYPFNEYNYCFALDGTLGKDGYIGFDAGVNQSKFVVDPVTKDFTILDEYSGVADIIYVPALLNLNKKSEYKFDENGSTYITGSTSANCEKIKVKAFNINGINDEYELKEYKKGDTSFKYGVNEKWDNLVEGTNTYTFTAYCSGDQVVSDSYSIEYTTYDWDDLYSEYYTPSWDSLGY